MKVDGSRAVPSAAAARAGIAGKEDPIPIKIKEDGTTTPPFVCKQ